MQKEKNEQAINELNQERNDLKRDLRKAQENLKISTGIIYIIFKGGVYIHSFQKNNILWKEIL